MNPRPKRGELWTCTVCGAGNEPDKKTCMNANNPVLHPPAPAPRKS